MGAGAGNQEAGAKAVELLPELRGKAGIPVPEAGNSVPEGGGSNPVVEGRAGNPVPVGDQEDVAAGGASDTAGGVAIVTVLEGGTCWTGTAAGGPGELVENPTEEAKRCGVP